MSADTQITEPASPTPSPVFDTRLLLDEAALSRLPPSLRRATMESQRELRERFGVPEVPPQTPVQPPPAPALDPEPPPEQEPGPTAVEPPAPAPDEDWKQKFLTLQGKYDAEVPGLNAELRTIRRELAQAQAQIEGLRKAPEPAPAPVVDNDPDAQPLTKEEIEDLGPDLVRYVNRMAKVVAKDTVAKLTGEITKLRNTVDAVTGTVGKVETNQLFVQLDKELGQDWRKQNDDPGFNLWLRQIDPFTGVSRQTLLDNAVLAKDTGRVVALFRGYTAPAVASSPAPAAPAPSPAMGKGTPTPPRSPLETLVMPGTARGGPAPTPATNEPVPVRESEISRFNDDIARGKYRGREAAFKEVQARITDAISRGTVIPG